MAIDLTSQRVSRKNNTLGDVGAWGQYDQSRVDIWKDYAAHMRNY